MVDTRQALSVMLCSVQACSAGCAVEETPIRMLELSLDGGFKPRILFQPEMQMRSIQIEPVSSEELSIVQSQLVQECDIVNVQMIESYTSRISIQEACQDLLAYELQQESELNEHFRQFFSKMEITSPKSRSDSQRHDEDSQGKGKGKASTGDSQQSNNSLGTQLLVVHSFDCGQSQQSNNQMMQLQDPDSKQFIERRCQSNTSRTSHTEQSQPGRNSTYQYAYLQLKTLQQSVQQLSRITDSLDYPVPNNTAFYSTKSLMRMKTSRKEGIL